MKKIMIAILLVIAYFSYSFFSKPDVIGSFQEFSKDLVSPIESTYNKGYYILVDDNDKGYHKIDKVDFKYTCDIKQNDSVMYPYIGILEVSSTFNTYKSFQTKSEAINTSEIIHSFQDKKRLTFRYSNGQWLEDGSYSYIGEKWIKTDDFSLVTFKCHQS